MRRRANGKRALSKRGTVGHRTGRKITKNHIVACPQPFYLVEDAESEVARYPEEVKTRIKEMLNQRLAGRREAIVWPVKTQDLPDEDPTFLVGYLPLEFAAEGRSEQERIAREMLANYGDRPRRYRNGVGLAVPEKKQIESIRRAARYLLAVERVEQRKVQLRLSTDLLDQLRERRRTEEAAAESALRALYASVWLPRVEEGRLEIERVEVGGRPLQAVGVHERVMELLMNIGTPKVHDTLRPRKIIDRLCLGEAPAPGEPARLGIRASDVCDAFFAFLEPPRLTSAAAIRKAIVDCVAEGMFAYTSSYEPDLGPNQRYQVPRNKVVLGRSLSEDEIDFDSGFLIMPEAMPEVVPPTGQWSQEPGKVRDEESEENDVDEREDEQETKPPIDPGQAQRSVRLCFTATRDQVFKAFPAIANLADRSDTGKVVIRVEATSATGFDASWLRNAVEEPLDEADLQWDRDGSAP
jgi:hypothetical protein